MMRNCYNTCSNTWAERHGHKAHYRAHNTRLPKRPAGRLCAPFGRAAAHARGAIKFSSPIGEHVGGLVMRSCGKPIIVPGWHPERGEP